MKGDMSSKQRNLTSPCIHMRKYKEITHTEIYREKEICIVSLLDRVVDVKPSYILVLFPEMPSPNGHLSWYIT